MIQYERRFGELYSEVDIKLTEIKKYYGLLQHDFVDVYNQYSDTKSFLLKEINLINSINESFDRANTSVKKAAEENSKKLDNVIKYAQKKINPSQVDDDKPQFDSQKIEYLVHDLTNQERKNHGLSQLVFDSEITQIARGHSQDMASREYFAHETPEGFTPSDRAEQAGYFCQKIVGLQIYSGIAENIFQGYLFNSYYTLNGEITSYDWSSEEEIAKTTVEGWMNSPGHRDNILTDIFDREGIGVEIMQDNKVYVTQNFC